MQRRRFLQAAATAALSTALPGAFGALPGLVPADVDAADATAFRAARRMVDTRFGRIALAERGSGDAALFLHGFPLNGYQWRGALARLSPYRRCIAPDFLGLGHTEVAPGQGMTPDDQVAMLAGLMDALEIERTDLVANDSGGAVAQLLMVRHPSRVRSVLLTNCDTTIECPPAALAPVFALAREERFVAEWLAPWLADKALARSPEGLGGLTYTCPGRLGDDAIETYLAPLVHDPARTHAYTLALDHNVLADIEPALRASRIPTRVVWGMADETFSPESADYLDRTLGNPLGVRRVDGARLFFPEEFPDLIAEEARRLWQA